MTLSFAFCFIKSFNHTNKLQIQPPATTNRISYNRILLCKHNLKNNNGFTIRKYNCAIQFSCSATNSVYVGLRLFGSLPPKLSACIPTKEFKFQLAVCSTWLDVHKYIDTSAVLWCAYKLLFSLELISKIVWYVHNSLHMSDIILKMT